MKTRKNSLIKWMLACCALQLAGGSSQAQSNVLISAFDNDAEVTDNNGQPWQNWFGTAYYQAVFSTNDANGDPNSGSLRIEAFYPDSGIGGCCGPQFVAINGYDGINPPLPGNGSSAGGPVATNVSFDVRFDPASTNDGSGNWPTIEVGTRGDTFNQYNFGTFTIPVTNTDWVHVNIPIGPSENWANIPHIYFKHYSTALAGWVYLYIDNIVFTMSEVEIPPPTLAIKKAKPALRAFAGPTQYARTQLASVDTNQSWVGGTYPVSYSFTISDYEIDPPLNEFHVFLTPLKYVQGGAIDSFTDYSTASNNFRVQITGGEAGTTTVFANIDYKTNSINANPDHLVASLTNETATGTWTLQFTSATDGTLTAPGGTSASFSLPADVAATFANPLVAFFGVQPNPVPAIGQHVDFTHIQTMNVAAPGVPIDSDFTTGMSIDTNVWRAATVSADASNLVVVDSTKPWWLQWGFPDTGFQLSTKADLSDTAVQWKTPSYYTGYDTNVTVLKKTLGSRVSALIPEAALPSADGSSNGVAAGSAYFRLENPAPAE